MWTWSEFHCDYVYPVDANVTQIYIRNLSVVSGRGAFNESCVSNIDSNFEHGWIMDPRNVQENWTQSGTFRRHSWIAEHACLKNGSCVYIGNNTYEPLFGDGFIFDIPLNLSTILIILFGSFSALVTVLGNVTVSFFYIYESFLQQDKYIEFPYNRFSSSSTETKAYKP